MSVLLWGLVVLAALSVLGPLTRLRALHPLKERHEPPDPSSASEYRLLAAEGVEVSRETYHAAIAHARSHGLDVLDLVPGDTPPRTLLGLARSIDFVTYTRDPFHRGMSAGHALIATTCVLARAQVSDSDHPARDVVSFFRMAVGLKHYAGRSAGFAIAPALDYVEPTARELNGILREVAGGHAQPIVIWGILGFGLLVGLAFAYPLQMGVLLGVHHLEVLVGLAARGWRPDARLGVVLALRSLLGLGDGVRSLLAGMPPPHEELDAKRAEYTAELERGVERFLEVPRTDCPFCGDTSLRLRLQCPDRPGAKPGRFRLDECEACGHVFQNPRLTIEGLDFYYRDFYEGLGEKTLDDAFSAQKSHYLDRARMIAGDPGPERWLDVGGGHGHFCCAAREVHPSTRFDCLDLAEAVEDAERRGWAERGLRGLFPEMAGDLREAYDVVSMSHYLEHTREPEVEIRAAHQVLRPGGHLMIEVPNPTCLAARVLGSWWVGWLQPQHLHMLSPTNLARLLEREGFEPVAWHHAEAHGPVDLTFAVFYLVDLVGGRGDSPWLPPPGPWARFRHVFFATVGLPLLGLGRGLDLLMAPVAGRLGASNNVRVLARRLDPPRLG